MTYLAFRAEIFPLWDMRRPVLGHFYVNILFNHSLVSF